MENKRKILYRTLIYEIPLFFAITAFVQQVTEISFLDSIYINTTILAVRIGSRYIYDLYYDKVKNLFKKEKVIGVALTSAMKGENVIIRLINGSVIYGRK